MKKIVIFGIIAICLYSCTLTRALVYWSPDIDDHKIFPYTEIHTGDNVFQFHKGNEETLKNYIVKAQKRDAKDTVDLPLDEFLEKTTGTVSFIVIRNDSILYEKYFRGYDRSTISNVFSVSKSVTSMLTGIAVDEGYIESVHDPVTKYIPELKKKDPRFGRLTIEHLLNMRSGLKFEEAKETPFSRYAKIYYGTNLLGTVKRTKFAHEPGTVKDYQSISTALLGLVVQRATGQGLGEYLEKKVWVPVGMENRATWSLDDRRHNMAKGFASLNTTAIDLAKIGRLYLHNGQWEGKRIVDSAWVKESVTPYTDNFGYQYSWYSVSASLTNPETKTRFYADSLSAEHIMSTRGKGWKYYRIFKDEYAGDQWRVVGYPGDFYALGIYNQVLFVNPKKDIIVVRLGESSNMNWPAFIYRMTEDL